MKAAFFKEHGGAEKILYVDYRDPVPEAGGAHQGLRLQPGRSAAIRA